MGPPVLQQARRLGAHPPIDRIRDAPPRVHSVTNLVDDRRKVLLPLRRGPPVFVEGQTELSARSLRLGHRREERGGPAAAYDLGCRLPGGVELPMPGRAPVGRVQDRPLEEPVYGRIAGFSCSLAQAHGRFRIPPFGVPALAQSGPAPWDRASPVATRSGRFAGCTRRDGPASLTA